MVHVKKISELNGHSGAVYSLEKVGEENYFYSGSSDKIIAKWNLNTLEPEKFAAQLPAIIYSLCYLPELNTLLAGTSEGKMHVIDLNEKKETKILLNHHQPLFHIQHTTEHKTILSVGGDGILSFISTEDFRTVLLLKLCNEKLRAIDIFGNIAAIACGDGFVRIVNLKEQKVMSEFQAHTGSVYTVKFSPDGKKLLSGGKDAHLKVWLMENVLGLNENTISAVPQPSTLNLQPLHSIPAHNYAIYSIAFSPDKKLFATASRDKTIKIWDSDSLKVLARINKENYNGHINSVNTLHWDLKSNLLISAGDDRKIMIWDVK